MKRVTLRSLFFIILLLSSNLAQLYWQNPVPGGNRLNAIHVISPKKLIAVGDCSTLLLSADNGASWYPAAIGKAGNISDVDSYGENLLIAVGQGGLILRSVDGGMTWASKILSAQTDLAAVSILSTNLVVATGGTRIFRSTDGGATWAAPVTPTLSQMKDVVLVNNQLGYAVGNALYRSTDGSASFVKMNISVAGPFQSIAIPSLSAIFIATTNAVYCSTDGGSNWTQTVVLNGVSIDRMLFTSNLIGYLIGKNNLVSKTTDGGYTWNVISPLTSALTLHGAACAASGDLFVCGDAGYLGVCKSGQWTTLNNSVFTGEIYDISFLTDRLGFAVCDSGAILRTTDGGGDWSAAQIPGAMQFHKIVPLSKDIIFAFGKPGCMSTNGGLTWGLLRLPETATITDCFFLNELTGIVCGLSGELYITRDGGLTWDPMPHSLYSDLKALRFVDALTGFVIAADTIFKTTDGGKNWQPKLCNAGALSSILMQGTSIGYAAGGTQDSGFIYKTSDCGEHWTPVAGVVSSGLTALKQSPGGVLYAAGWNATLLRSTDGGESWTNICYQTTRKFTGLSVVNDSAVWVCGEGIILTTVSGKVTAVEGAGLRQSLRLSLSNYPNPFNPVTQIVYQIPVEACVSLWIYDMSGRQLWCSERGRQKPGTYTVSYNACRLGSGIYVCVVRAGAQQATRKLLLLK